MKIPYSILGLFGTVLIFLTGCLYQAHYDIGLQEVERPAQAKEKYGEQKITQIEEEGVAKYSFDDQMINIVIYPTHSGIYFTLKNKTSYSIKIIWDEAAFVDENGSSHRVKRSFKVYTCVIFEVASGEWLVARK